MIRISLSYVYRFATSIEPLSRITAEAKVSDWIFTIIIARQEIEELLDKSVFSYSLRSCRASANELLTILNSYMWVDQPDDPAFKEWEVISLTRALSQFKTVLLAEMETLNAHFVTQKRGYDTATLITYAEYLFPPDLPGKVPEAVFDIREAGKCIAYELPTAAGYHLHRANEAVLHRYYDAVTGGKPRPSSRNIGDYLNALKTHSAGDPRLLAALKDLKDLHRNPLIHPDQTLETIDEAIALLNGIHNAVVHMLKVIAVAKNASNDEVSAVAGRSA